MNDDQYNEQQSDLDNNAVTQMEQQIAGKAKNMVKDAANKTKKATMDAVKKAIKVALKVTIKILKVLFTTPPICFFAWAVVIGILIIALTLSAFDGILSIFKRDVKSGDVSTSEQNISIYNYPVGTDFSVEASGDIVKNAQQIKKYIQPLYRYHQGNNMANYPLKIGDVDKSGYGVDCSTYVTWVLIMSGYSQFKDRWQLTTADFWGWITGNGGYNFSDLGWTYHNVTESNLTISPGDLLLKTSLSRHIEIYAGNGTYGAGSDHQIQNKNYRSYIDCSLKKIINERKFYICN